MDSSFPQNLKIRLQNPLPGARSQFKMAHNARVELAQKDEQFAKQSAVLILLTTVDNRLKIVLTERQENLKKHSGQMSFPGGKKDDADATLQATAIRETQEEIGVQISENQVLGQLTPLYIPVSNFMVNPFVCFVASPLVFSPNLSEVKTVYLFDLEEFTDPKNIVDYPTVFLGQEINMPSFRYQNKIVWGATAMIISELMEVINTITQ